MSTAPLTPAPSASQPRGRRAKRPPKRVVILGGGIAGMTAAHELIVRGFEVALYEKRGQPGGKARSIDVPNSADGNRKPLPGEHGFRFFPGFYKHIPHTMKRIPFGNRRVYDNLVPTHSTLIARENGQRDLEFPAQPPMTPRQLFKNFQLFSEADLGIPPKDLRTFARKLLQLLTSCEQRRLEEYEKESWLKYVEAHASDVNPNYLKYCADGLTRALVACQAAQMSARTGGCILLQLMFDLVTPGIQANRVLNGPTSEVWLKPWLEHLRRRGKGRFQFFSDATVERIEFANGMITGVAISRGETAELVRGDYYISALPVEVLEPEAVDNTVGTPRPPLITPEMKAADPQLGNLHLLKTEWMNGIQYYLDRDVRVVRGHTLYIDSKWSLTSICQQQFWSEIDLSDYGRGNVNGVLSVDISDWNREGTNGKKARDCNGDEIKDEVLKQIRLALNDDGQKEFDQDVKIVDWFLDSAIQFPNPNRAENAEPLLINTAGSWEHRPEAETKIPNFFLAADFVRTHTDLATMEAANEAARRAVNGILKRAKSWQRPCKVWRLQEPWVFSIFKWYDHWRFSRNPRLEHSRLALWLALLSAVPLWYILRVFSVVHYWLQEKIASPVWQWARKRVERRK